MEEKMKEEERMIREQEKEFEREVIMNSVEKEYMEEKKEKEMFKIMGKEGIMGVKMKEEYGEENERYVEYGMVEREVERID